MCRVNILESGCQGLWLAVDSLCQLSKEVVQVLCSGLTTRRNFGKGWLYVAIRYNDTGLWLFRCGGVWESLLIVAVYSETLEER